MKNILLLSSCIYFPSVLLSQIWTLPAQTIYVQVSYTSGSYNSTYDSVGEIQTSHHNVFDNTIQLDAQYALNNKLTLLLKVPYKFERSESGIYIDVLEINDISDGSLNYPGNIELAGVYNIKKIMPASNAISYINASLQIEANTSQYNFITGLQTGFNSWAFKPGISYASTMTKTWFSVYIATAIRTNNYSSDLIENLEYGYKPVKYLFLAASVSGKNSLNNGEYCDCRIKQTALYLNNQTYFAGGIKAGFIYKKLSLNFAYTSALLAKNSPNTAFVTAGILYRSQE